MEDLRGVLRADVVKGAQRLLGCKLWVGEQETLIVETEAYAHDDPACHAFGKYKMKNMAMFGPPGHAYVYFTYGNHWMLCVSAHEEGNAAAVLIRAVMPLSGIPEGTKLNGPGRLTRSLKIDSRINGIDLLNGSEDVRIESCTKLLNIGTSKRIGITKGKGDETLWRYVSVQHLDWCTPHRFNREINRLIIKTSELGG